VKAFTAKYGDIKQYAPYFYDGTMAIVEADEEGGLHGTGEIRPDDAQSDFSGATGRVEFDAKGDRKDADMTIFRLQSGRLRPVAIVRAGSPSPFGA
jgi:branched-chain amino acid transport system substrate-binding protein